jgi:hypothetical protein
VLDCGWVRHRCIRCKRLARGAEEEGPGVQTGQQKREYKVGISLSLSLSLCLCSCVCVDVNTKLFPLLSQSPSPPSQAPVLALLQSGTGGPGRSTGTHLLRHALTLLHAPLASWCFFSDRAETESGAVVPQKSVEGWTIVVTGVHEEVMYRTAHRSPLLPLPRVPRRVSCWTFRLRCLHWLRLPMRAQVRTGTSRGGAEKKKKRKNTGTRLIFFSPHSLAD